MKKLIITLTVAALAGSAAAPAFAQFPKLPARMPGMGSLPGLGGAGVSSAAAVDPDAFLAETIETTKYMMLAAHILAVAADASGQRATDANLIKAIQSSQDVKELNALKANFEQDVAAINANQESTAQLEARYAKMTAEQRARIASAAYNFSLGMYRNVKLSKQAPEVLASMKSDPRLLVKAGRLKTAAELVAMQVKGTASMAGSMRKIMAAGKVAAPAEAESTKAKEISFT